MTVGAFCDRRAAFNSLFGAATEARRAGVVASTPSAQRPAGAAGSSAINSAASPIDLTGPDEEEEEPVTSGKVQGRFREEEPVSSASAAPSASASTAAAAASSGPGAELNAWFASSSLTGRLHGFGFGDAPLPAGLRANALPHAILDEEDEEATGLPSRLADPATLRAARRWVSEHASL